ncbi:MAG: hypothetical protein HOK21_15880 [Rhodospirillaceae bacterium]|jgi:hypothetical protein|nr:hypothetical protein [Rhodospirillaceae bacterium]MBT4045044.1 hypothetical protein [Rhodospirillaceae bacterium]MBT4688789.1 hypothetical protein [Rhodospirillaceae bacterium]MBT5083385.1 hypothetical protein [Rhodospirillaceae bacterium]MBT5525565.1 hypothetical protein [Rhodospirillaceae bacterium]
MLKRIDRLQIAVPDRAAVAEKWIALLGAEPNGEDKIAALGAKRSRLRLGTGYIEILEPDGTGIVADAVNKRGGGHYFAAGVSTDDVPALVAHMASTGVETVSEGQQAFLAPEATGNMGLRAVISREETLPSVGAIDFLYEATLLVNDPDTAIARCADVFALNRDIFVPIPSKEFGYNGSLTLFQPNRLFRFEVITPVDMEKTLGRFFARTGPSFYMSFAECSQLDLIAERAMARGDGFTPVPSPIQDDQGRAETIFLHPPSLGGMMLGLSRPTLAWRWSGAPDRVEKMS